MLCFETNKISVPRCRHFITETNSIFSIKTVSMNHELKSANVQLFHWHRYFIISKIEKKAGQNSKLCMQKDPKCTKQVVVYTVFP